MPGGYRFLVQNIFGVTAQACCQFHGRPRQMAAPLTKSNGPVHVAPPIEHSSSFVEMRNFNLADLRPPALGPADVSHRIPLFVHRAVTIIDGMEHGQMPSPGLAQLEDHKAICRCDC